MDQTLIDLRNQVQELLNSLAFGSPGDYRAEIVEEKDSPMWPYSLVIKQKEYHQGHLKTYYSDFRVLDSSLITPVRDVCHAAYTRIASPKVVVNSEIWIKPFGRKCRLFLPIMLKL